MDDITLDNGLKVYSYGKTETAFLYKEIFVEDNYIRSITGHWGIPESHRDFGKVADSAPRVKKGDTVVAAGKEKKVEGKEDPEGAVRSRDSGKSGSGAKDELTLGIELKEGDTVIDVGANIGMFALRAHQACAGDLTLYGFEPIEPIHKYAAKNAERAAAGEAGLVPRKGAKMKIFQKGLGEKPGSAKVMFHPNMSVWSTMNSSMAKTRNTRFVDDVGKLMWHENWFANLLPIRWLLRCLVYLVLHFVFMFRSKELTIQIDTLSNVIDAEKITKIDLIKCDCEGNEIPTLKGIEDRHWPLIRQVILEMESFDDVQEASKLLRSKGFNTVSEASQRKSVEDGTSITSEVSTVIAVRA